jgi:hypothetical protein
MFGGVVETGDEKRSSNIPSLMQPALELVVTLSRCHLFETAHLLDSDRYLSRSICFFLDF